MNRAIEEVVEENGWNESTLNALLLDFLEDNKMVDKFLKHVSDDDQTLGLESAKELLKYCDELNLYECEVGVFSTEDPSTPHDVYFVVVASEDKDIAKEQAKDYADSHISKVGSDYFEIINDVEDYIE